MAVASYGNRKRVHENRDIGRKMTYHVDKEPVLCVDGVCVEEEGSPYEALRKEVRSEIREPFEDVEARAGFEHEEGNRMLDE